MDFMFTVMNLAAVLIFSLCCALLLEEMVVGGLFRIFFAPAVVARTKETGDSIRQ